MATSKKIAVCGKNRKLKSENQADRYPISLAHYPQRNTIMINSEATGSNKQDWVHFTDSRIALALQYPKVTPQGTPVEVDENQDEDTIRLHFRSTGSREVYFEITKYQDLSPQMEYEQHKENLERRPEKFILTDLREIHWMSQPAYEYSIR